MSLLAATWMSAAANVLLFIGAVFTVVYAGNAYREQSRQTRLLKEQSDRDISQRRRAQASQVFTWVENRPFNGNGNDLRAACIKNTSRQPVYDIAQRTGRQARPRTILDRNPA